MSVRLVVLTPRLNRAFIRRAGSGLRAYLPKFFRSSLGDVALNLSFWPIGMMTSLISGLPRRETWAQLPFGEPVWAPRASNDTRRRSVVDQTPTTAFLAFMSATWRPSTVT